MDYIKNILKSVAIILQNNMYQLAKIKNLLLKITIFLVCYFLTWYGLMHIICSYLDKNYSNKVIDLEYVKFQYKNSKPCGFPLKFGICIYSPQEEIKNYNSSYNKPLYLWYNMLTQKLGLSYYGQIITESKSSKVRYKLEGNFNYLFKYKPRISLLKILYEKKYFELINFIEDFEAYLKNVRLYNMEDGKLLSESRVINIKILPDQKHYYEKPQDLMHKIPATYNIYSNIHSISSMKEPIEAFNVHSFLIPSKSLELYLKATFLSKAKNASIENILDNFSLNIDNYEVKYQDFESQGNLSADFFKNQNNMKLRLISNISSTFQETLFITFKHKILDIINYLKSLKILESNSYSIFNNIIQNPEKYLPQLHKLGILNTNIDVLIEVQKNISTINIKKFIFSNNFFTLEAYKKLIINPDISWNLDGLLIIKKYKNFVNIVVGYMQKVFMIFSAIDNSLKALGSQHFFEKFQSFLKTISNYPDNDSQDLYYNIKLGNKIKNGKIGSATSEQVLKGIINLFNQYQIENQIYKNIPKPLLEELRK